MSWLLTLALLSYLVGSIPSGYIAGRFAGVDIRRVGSGNIGATNVSRTLGKRYGYPVFIADFAKGLFVIFAANRFGPQAGGSIPVEIFDVDAAICCVLGNAFPLWLGFRGGKGVAVSAGLLFALMPWAGVIVIVVWVAIFFVTGYVSLASIVAALVLPVAVFVLLELKQMTQWWFFYISAGLTAFIIFRHRSNILRLVRGTEQRFRKGAD